MRYLSLFLAIILLTPMYASAATVLASYKNNNNSESIYRDTGPTTYRGAAQPFSHSAGATYRVSSIMFALKKTGAPTEPLLFSIYTYNAGTPVGTLIGQGTLAAASVATGSFAEYTVSSFTANIDLATATNYWVRVHTANDGVDNINYFQVAMSNSAIPYSAEYYETGSGFAVETNFNLYFEIQGNLPVDDPITPILSLVRSWWLL